MAITKASLKQKIEASLLLKGFDLTNEYSRISELTDAIAEAVVTEITTNAQVVVSSGSSAGTYKVD